MTKDTQRSGFHLLLIGLLGVVYFWATDPKLGLMRSTATVDAVHDAMWGTYVGLAVSGIVIVVGLWLLAKRTV